jgi:hypothetical protein
MSLLAARRDKLRLRLRDANDYRAARSLRLLV